MGKRRGKINQREWLDRRLSQPFTNECVLWPFRIKENGYGTVSVDGQTRLAHRYSLSRHTGEPITTERFALHSCRNRSCFNPKHLRWGTHIDNMNDKLREGTERVGADRWNAKFDERIVRRIRLDCRASTKVAEEYGVSPMAIRHIWRGKRWQHLEWTAEERAAYLRQGRHLNDLPWERTNRLGM